MAPLIGVADCGAPIVKVFWAKLVSPADRLNSALLMLRPCAKAELVKTRYRVANHTYCFIKRLSVRNMARLCIALICAVGPTRPKFDGILNGPLFDAVLNGPLINRST